MADGDIKRAGAFTVGSSSAFTVGGRGVNGLTARSQAGIGSEIVNNQLGATVQQDIQSHQGSRGAASYPYLSGGLGGSPADVGSRLNMLGFGETTPMGPYGMEGVSGRVQVSLLPPSFRILQ